MIFSSSILMGMLFSPFYPYLYALPSKYNIELNSDNSFNALIYYAAGEAGTCAVIGELMAWIHPIMLFVSVFVLSIVNFIIMKYTVKGLEKPVYKNVTVEKKRN